MPNQRRKPKAAAKDPAPAYLRAAQSGRLRETLARLQSLLRACSLCPRGCGVDRTKDETGYCLTGAKARVYSFLAHHGEEPPLSGTRGSGTIFFSGCNMRCAYCQNHRFSQSREGREVFAQELAQIMLTLQARGCHNINLVTPAHVLPQILEGLALAIPQGLRIPLVYNTNAYERRQILELLEGIVDVYLPDMRYGSDDEARTVSDAADYLRYNREAVKEMHRQVGIAQFDRHGLIVRGLIIRHLVLPQDIAGTRTVLDFISRELSPETYVSLMSQYLPAYRALKDPRLCRRISKEEYRAAEEALEKAGLCNGWTQDGHGLESLAGIHLKPGDSDRTGGS